MNTSEAIVYSGCVRHFLKLPGQPTSEQVMAWLKENSKDLSDQQINKIHESSVLAIANAK